MYPRSSSLRNKWSEDQLISELIHVFQRHNIKFGEPHDLAHLGMDLVSNDAFRNDLFRHCDVISHMSEAGLSPEQLLILAAQALGGPAITNESGAVDIPLTARSAFLIGYEIWIKERDYVKTSIAPIDSAANSPQLSPIAPGTPLDSLTLNQLKRYIEDIEFRINRIEPHLDQMSAPSNSSTEDVAGFNSIESQNGHAPQQLPPEPSVATSPLAEFALPSTAPEAFQNRSFIQRKVLPPIGPVLSSFAPLTPTTAPVRSTPDTEPDVSPLQRLRLAVIALSVLSILAIASTAIFAYRYLHPENQSIDTAQQITQTPQLPGQVKAQSGPPYTQTVLNPIPPSHSLSSPFAHSDTPERFGRSNRGDTRSAGKLSPYPPSAASQTIASPPPPPLARSDSQQSSTAPTQSLQTAAAPPANSNPTPALPTPVTQATPPAVAVSPATTSTQPPSTPADPPAAPPVVRPVSPSNGPVSVPSATMMRYAVATPAPVFPNRFNRPDDIVLVEATISPTGAVIDTQTISGPSDLRPAVTQAMKAWRFKPYVIDGNPVSVVTTFTFALKRK